MSKIKKFQGEWMKLGEEDEITLLSKTQERYEAANQALAKVSFNHVFNEVKRDTEFMNLSKMLKSNKGTG